MINFSHQFTEYGFHVHKKREKFTQVQYDAGLFYDAHERIVGSKFNAISVYIKPTVWHCEDKCSP